MLVDTNILVDVFENDPQWADWSIAQLHEQSKTHQLFINSIIYSELSLTFATVESLDQTVNSMGLIMLEVPKPALFLAGNAFIQYRRNGGVKKNVLGDFFIGAHAAVTGLPILTRDIRRYKNYFPTVQLVSPGGTLETQS